jgi:hypothetical protein
MVCAKHADTNAEGKQDISKRMAAQAGLREQHQEQVIVIAIVPLVTGSVSGDALDGDTPA